jgi:hypothetical protein
MAAFERACRLTISEGRRVKAFRVPGTAENGRWWMFRESWIRSEDYRAAALSRAKSA